jgi:hypothetical protein
VNGGWNYYTYIVQAYGSPGVPIIWNAGWWVYTGYLPGNLLHCPGQYIVNPPCYMSRTTLPWQIVDAWREGLPTRPDTGSVWREWLYTTYAFNAGLTASTWYSMNFPWKRSGVYAGDVEPWRLSQMEPVWPVMADLRTYINIGNGHPGPIHASHQSKGFNVTYADGGTLWLRMEFPADLSDTGEHRYDSHSYNGASLSYLWQDFVEER